jgi:hypothetical protein
VHYVRLRFDALVIALFRSCESWKTPAYLVPYCYHTCRKQSSQCYWRTNDSKPDFSLQREPGTREFRICHVIVCRALTTQVRDSLLLWLSRLRCCLTCCLTLPCTSVLPPFHSACPIWFFSRGNSGISLKRHTILVEHKVSYLQLYNIKCGRVDLNLHFFLNHDILQFSVRSARAWILTTMSPLGQLFLRAEQG